MCYTRWPSKLHALCASNPTVKTLKALLNGENVDENVDIKYYIYYDDNKIFDMNANVTTTDGQRLFDTPFVLLCRNERTTLDLLKFAISCGGDLKSKTQQTDACMALCQNWNVTVDMLECALSNGGDIFTVRDYTDYTPMYCQNEYGEQVEMPVVKYMVCPVKCLFMNGKVNSEILSYILNLHGSFDFGSEGGDVFKSMLQFEDLNFTTFKYILANRGMYNINGNVNNPEEQSFVYEMCKMYSDRYTPEMFLYLISQGARFREKFMEIQYENGVEKKVYKTPLEWIMKNSDIVPLQIRKICIMSRV